MTHKDIFLKEFSKFKKKDVNLFLLAAIILNLTMLIFDYFVSGDDFIYYVIDRGFINCGLTLLAIILSNNKFVYKNFVYVGLAIYVVTGAGMILLFLVNYSPYYLATLLMLMLIGMPLFFVAYKGIFMVNICFLIAFGAVQYFNYSNDITTYIVAVNMLNGFILLDFGISYMLHKNMTSLIFETEKIESNNTQLKESVDNSVGEIQKLNHDTIYSLAILAESHDDFTGGHLERVGTLSKMLTSLLPDDSFTKNGIDKKLLIENIELASMLHDIGKIDIPVNILQKNGKLTPEERTIIETHSLKGYEILANIAALHHNNETILLAKDIAKYHHENWDGTGYP